MHVSNYVMSIVSILLLCPLVYSNDDLYSNEWLLEATITDDEARNLATAHGLSFVKRLHTGHLLLTKRTLPRRSKVKQRHVDESILKHDYRIRSVEQQRWKQVSLRQYDPTINDPKWSEMWYLRKSDDPSLNVPPSWQLNYTGRGVTIAIVDDGVDYNHQDLVDRYESSISYDVYDRDPYPLPEQGRSHGTKCAGVALSTRNNICAVGAAFEAKLQAIRLIGPFGITDAGEIDAFTRAGTMVSSNSWGGVEGTTFDGPSPSVKQALMKGTSQFRNGKGIIYVFAAGNGGFYDDCNCDGYVNSIYTIGISSVDKALEPPGYAEPCTAILASAFSGAGGNTDNVCTTDVGNGCTSSFSGTSAAAPMAAGIIALVLQVNPSLTWRDVQEIIIKTSDSTGLKFGSFQTNGAGRQVSVYYGYGLLNTKAMTDAAKSWTTLPTQHTCPTNQEKANLKVQGSNDKRCVSSILVADGCNNTKVCVNSIEHVQVIITFEYSKRGAIEFTLLSPMGSSSKLLTPRNQDKDSGVFTWTFMSVHHWGETAVGRWNLTMSLKSDFYSSGSLISWQLVFHGTGVGCTNDTSPCQNCNIYDQSPPSPPLPVPPDRLPIIIIVIIAVILVIIILILSICIHRHYHRKRVSTVSSDMR